MAETDGDAYARAGGRATPQQMARKHIYVMNGSAEFLGIVRHLLQDKDYNVTTTNFVPHSFETIETAQPSLLIIDLVMGEQAGWTLLSQLRQSVMTQRIPVLLISTRPEILHQAQERYSRFGADQFLLKPFDLDDLLIRIDDMIGHA